MPRTRTQRTTTDDQTEVGLSASGAVESDEEATQAGAGAGLRMPGLPMLSNVEPRRMLLWGGLAAVAAVEIIEWPVALAIGAGSWLTEQLTKQDVERDRARTTL